jgi:hypothetical protein
MSIWSEEYIFFKNLNKVSCMFGLRPHSYLAQATLIFSRKRLHDLRNLENFNFGTVYSSLVQYLTLPLTSTNHFTLNFRGSN